MTQIPMPHINQVALSGFLEDEPEFRLKEDGTMILRFSIIHCYGFREESGQLKKEFTNIPVIAYENLAEYFCQKLHRKSNVFLTGKLSQIGSKLGVQVRCIQLIDKVKSA